MSDVGSGASDATEAHGPSAGVSSPGILIQQEKVYVPQPVGEHKRKRGVSVERLVSTSHPRSAFAPVRVTRPRGAAGASIACGTQPMTFCCGRSTCETCTFNVVRADPTKGPFNWQELRVTMCRDGEMSPLLLRLQRECRNCKKMYVHLRSRGQETANTGFVRPEHTARNLGMKPGDDNSELTLYLLPLRVMHARMWPGNYDRKRYVHHFEYSPQDKACLHPIQSLATTSESSGVSVELTDEETSVGHKSL